MITEKIPEPQKLSLEEKLMLFGELREELAVHPEAFPVREDHIELLEQRLEHFRQHPDDTGSWEAVTARLLASR